MSDQTVRVTGEIVRVKKIEGVSPKGPYSFLDCRVLVANRGFADVAIFDNEVSEGQFADWVCEARADQRGRVRLTFQTIWVG